ncbi:MAG: polyprenyl synthetase family protein [Legionella sp.]|nr:polyprenyl synthetase family protein [Legionella sp.]
MIQAVIEKYKERHEAYLKNLFDNTTIPAPLIREALYYCLFPGGKRIRPLLVYLLGELLDIKLPILDAIAAAVELTHCYSLIHDDLPAMDDDDLRRGKASCHKAFDEATAILVGDGLQALALQVLLEHLSPLLSPAQVIAVTIELISASGLSGMVSGQSLDLTQLCKPETTESQLCDIHHLKTGKLISACANMILATQASIDVDTASSFKTCMYHIGLVFQMQDDYLDQFAATHLGKSRSSDEANKKTTFVALYSKEQLEEKINNHYQIAIDCLHKFGSKNASLLALVHQLQARTMILIKVKY